MNWERVSLILGLVSFFLVTLDLFGERRIESLQGRISGFSERWRFTSIVELFTTEGLTRRQNFGCFLGLLIATVALATTVMLATYLGGVLPLDGVWRVAVMIPIAIAVFALSVVLTWIPFLVLILVGAILGDRSLRAVLWLIKRYELDGMMLVVGSVLFVTSTVISFVRTF